MHELSVAESLLNTLDAWQKENGGSLIRLKIVIGRLGGIDREALEYAWPMALETSGNPHLKRCRMEVEVLPLEFRCPACGKQILSEKLVMECPDCGCERLRRQGGRELILKEIEVEDV